MEKIPILMYHSIQTVTKSTVMRSLHVSPKRFRLQMLLLKIMGYKGLSLRELRPYLEGKRTGKVVGISFDDGYQNNLINAMPILKRYNFTATCYIVSKRVGLTNIWDKNEGITQSQLMTKAEIKKWLSNGMDIGAHTQSHPNLEKINILSAKDEILNCKEDLDRTFNTNIVDFCYPFGRLNDEICDLVKSAGYKSAVTMNRGRAGLLSDHMQLPRIPITYHTLPHLFLLKLFTKYEDKRSFYN